MLQSRELLKATYNVPVNLNQRCKIECILEEQLSIPASHIWALKVIQACATITDKNGIEKEAHHTKLSRQGCPLRGHVFSQLKSCHPVSHEGCPPGRLTIEPV